jgi:dihydrolipoamide dehydrogenase
VADEWDLVVVGAGPGGYVAALRAAQLGLRTVVVEMERAGGTCGNWGCIPSKALLADAALVADVRAAASHGIVADGLRVDFGKVVDRSREVAAQQARGVEHLFKKAKVDYLLGVATVVRGGVEVQTDGQPRRTLRARHVLVATGSAERTLPGLDVDGTIVQTSREALDDRVLPQSLVVIGGGAVGVEMAYVYASFGTRVTVVEMADVLLPGMDVDLGQELGRAFSRQGLRVMTGFRFERCERVEEGALVTVRGGKGAETLQAERVLVAVGRRPRTDGLGLEEVGVRLERGGVPVDGGMRSNVPWISAIGDIVGPLQLAHAASEQGVVAAETIARRGEGGAPIPPARIPLCVYCQPEVAAVGLTEAQAREHDGDVRVGRFPFRALGKAMATGHTAGFVKLVAGGRYGEVLGVHMIGHGVTDLVAEAGLALTLESTLDELIDTVHAHPTLAEALREAALAAAGRAINV